MQNPSDAAEVEFRILKMARVSRVLCILFKVAFCLFVMIVCAIIATSTMNGLRAGDPIADVIIGNVPVISSAILGSILLWVMIRIFSDVSRSRSPFTIPQARRIMMLGVLLLAYAITEAAVSVSPLHASIGIADLDYVTSPSLFLDIKLVVGSIVCFCLSYVFRYGALLQWFSDESL